MFRGVRFASQSVRSETHRRPLRTAECNLPSAEWDVAVGTVEFFVFAWLFCRLQNLLFDKNPEMGKLSKSYLMELQMREVLTEAEQAWLKKQFADVGIIKGEGEEN